jgi:serine/threonine protein kinase
MTEVDARYPRKFGPFVLVTPLLESGGVSLCPALRRRGSEEQRCLVTHLRPGGRHAPLLERRFRRAGEVARRLSHPCVAATLAVGRLEENLFIAHEFLDGVELNRVPVDEIDAETAAYIAREVTQALDYLHRFENRGLVHLGVTPSNIHVGFEGDVKLLECGLATSLRDHDGQPKSASAGQNIALSFHGSIRYAAPEVRAGGDGDARSDVFAVGMLLWDLLAGRRWPADDQLDRGGNGPTLRLDDGADDDSPSGAGRSRGPAGLYAVVAKAMNPDPDRRYADMGQLRTALTPFAHGRYTGRRALRAVLEQVIDVADSRQRLAEHIAEGRALLPEPDLLPVADQRQRGIDWAIRGAGLAALAGLAFLAEGRTGRSLATGTMSTPAPAVVALERSPHAQPVASAPAPIPLSPPVRTAPPKGTRDPADPLLVALASTPARPQRSAKPKPARPAVATAETSAVESTVPVRESIGTPPARTQADAKARAYDDLKSAEERFQWGDIEGAERLARTAVRNLADNPQAFYLLGVVLLAKGDAKEAKAAFERALAIDPKYNDADAKLHLANERATVTQN